MESMEFPGRRFTFPIVLDDLWNKEALKQYMRTIRDKAVYLPSNIQYLAKNNGLRSEEEALKLLVSSDWVRSTRLIRFQDLTFICKACVRYWLLLSMPIPCTNRSSMSPDWTEDESLSNFHSSSKFSLIPFQRRKHSYNS